MVKDISELKELMVEEPSIVRFDFLNGHENIMDKAGIIMDFIRNNANNIRQIEGKMPSVAHIPNKIEGFFGIKYKQISETGTLLRE